jgi:hypothetical protein
MVFSGFNLKIGTESMFVQLPFMELPKFVVVI